jgi:hypothetical protein
MLKLVRIAVVALVLYVVVNEAGPWIKEQLSSGSSGGDAKPGPVRCVYLADEANEQFGDRVGRVSGPGADPAVWEGFLGEVRGHIGAAQQQCHCDQESCRKALEAMTTLEDLLHELDNRFRGGVMERSAVRRQQAVNELLNEARVLAREGN